MFSIAPHTARNLLRQQNTKSYRCYGLSRTTGFGSEDGPVVYENAIGQRDGCIVDEDKTDFTETWHTCVTDEYSWFARVYDKN